MGVKFDPETGLEIFDPKTGKSVMEGDSLPPSLAIPTPGLPAASGSQPAMLPRNSGKAFFTKEAAAANLKGKVDEAAARRDLEKSYERNLALWKSLPKDKQMGSFNEWTETAFSPVSGRKVTGAKAGAKSGLDIFEGAVSGKDARRGTAGEKGLWGRLKSDEGVGVASLIPVIGPLLSASRAGNLLNEATYRAIGGQSEYERNLANYLRLKTPAPKTTFTEDVKGLGAAAMDPISFLRESLINPDEMGTNAALMAPGLGEGAAAEKFAKLLATSERFAKMGKLPRLAVKAGKVAAAHLPNAVAGGAINSARGESTPLYDFMFGAGTGVAQELAGGLVAKGAGKVAGKLMPKAPKAAVPPGFDKVNEARTTRVKDQGLTQDYNADAVSQHPITAEDVLAAGEAQKFAGRLTNTQLDRNFVDSYGHLFDPDIHTAAPELKVGMLREKIKGMLKAQKKTPAAPAKMPFSPEQVDALAAKYIAPDVDAAGIPDRVRIAGIKPIMDTHYKLARAKNAGMTLSDGSPIPLREEVGNLNVLEHNLEAERMANQTRHEAELARIEETRKRADTKEATKAEKDAANEVARLATDEAKAKRKQEVLDEKAKQDDIKYERDVTALASRLRIAARKEASTPGSYVQALSALKPEELGMVIDDAMMGSGRFDDAHQVMKDKLGEDDFNSLSDLRKSLNGNPKEWAAQSKELLGISEAEKANANAGAQKVMDNAVAGEQIRQDVASMEERAATTESEAESRRVTAEADAQAKEDHFLATSDDGAVNLLLETIKQDPSKAELLLPEGKGAKFAKNLSSKDAHFAKDAKTELEPLLINEARKIRSGEKSIPKGFF